MVLGAVVQVVRSVIGTVKDLLLNARQGKLKPLVALVFSFTESLRLFIHYMAVAENPFSREILFSLGMSVIETLFGAFNHFSRGIGDLHFFVTHIDVSSLGGVWVTATHLDTLGVGLYFVASSLSTIYLYNLAYKLVIDKFFTSEVQWFNQVVWMSTLVLGSVLFNSCFHPYTGCFDGLAVTVDRTGDLVDAVAQLLDDLVGSEGAVPEAANQSVGDGLMNSSGSVNGTG